MGYPSDSGHRLVELVERLGAEHPPIDLDSVDYSVKDAEAVNEQFGTSVDFMRRVELEVERNLRELRVLLPDLPEVDRTFTDDVWGPQELRHGAILDRWGQELGREPEPADTDGVSREMRILGALGTVPGIQDMCRMLFYLTGMTTERCAIWAYGRLGEQLAARGETALAATIVAPIRRQEPGHFAFYRMAAESLSARLRPWQRRVVRMVRVRTFAPVGVRNEAQAAAFGRVILELDGEPEIPEVTTAMARLERDLLAAAEAGAPVPDYVQRAFRDAVERAEYEAVPGVVRARS